MPVQTRSQFKLINTTPINTMSINTTSINTTSINTTSAYLDDNARINMEKEYDEDWFNKSIANILQKHHTINAEILAIQPMNQPVNITALSKSHIAYNIQTLEFDKLRNITLFFEFIETYLPIIYKHNSDYKRIITVSLDKINEFTQKLETYPYIPRTHIEIVTVAKLRDVMSTCEKTLNEL